MAAATKAVGNCLFFSKTKYTGDFSSLAPATLEKLEPTIKVLQVNKVFRSNAELEAYLAHSIQIQQTVDGVVKKLSSMTSHDVVRVASREAFNWLAFDNALRTGARYLQTLKTDLFIVKTMLQDAAAEIGTLARNATKTGQVAETALAGTEVKVTAEATAEMTETVGETAGKVARKGELLREVKSNIANPLEKIKHTKKSRLK